MAVVTFTNNWKNILDKLESVLRTEFKNALPVYVGETSEKVGSQYIRLDPVGTELLEYNVSSETREFSVNIFLYFGDKSDSRTTLDAILRLVSRVEALIPENVAMTYTNENSATESLFNCRMETTSLDAEADSEFYVVLWDFKAMHMGNIS